MAYIGSGMGPSAAGRRCASASGQSLSLRSSLKHIHKLIKKFTPIPKPKPKPKPYDLSPIVFGRYACKDGQEMAWAGGSSYRTEPGLC